MPMITTRPRRGELVKVESLFERYRKTLKAPQSSVEKIARTVIYKQTGYNLSSTQVSYTVATRTLHLRVPSLLRQHILLKQREILTVVETLLPTGSAPETLL
jgi:hypothetical protein